LSASPPAATPTTARTYITAPGEPLYRHHVTFAVDSPISGRIHSPLPTWPRPVRAAEFSAGTNSCTCPAAATRQPGIRLLPARAGLGGPTRHDSGASRGQPR